MTTQTCWGTSVGVAVAMVMVCHRNTAGEKRERERERDTVKWHFLREFYLCELCESSGSRINLYGINVTHHMLAMYVTFKRINKNRAKFSRGPF